MSKKIYNKVHGEFVDWHFVKRRKSMAIGMGYAPPKYLEFINYMLSIGYRVKLHEAHNTKSKYVTVYGAGDTNFKVRFSDHKPNRNMELAESCDFFVGRTHTGVRTTRDAVKAVEDCFNAL